VIEAVDSIELFRPADPIGGYVPFPASQAGQPLGVENLPFPHPQLFVGGAACGEIAGDLGEASDLPVGSMKGSDDAVRPDPRAIALDPPSFVFGAAVGRGEAQQLFRLSRGPLRLREEDRVRPIDDLFGAIAQNPLGPLIPARDPTFGRQTVDGEVAYLPDQLTKERGLLVFRVLNGIGHFSL